MVRDGKRWSVRDVDIEMANGDIDGQHQTAPHGVEQDPVRPRRRAYVYRQYECRVARVELSLVLLNATQR
jgi:hypothetical protein